MYNEYGQAQVLIVGFTDERENALDLGVLAPISFYQNPYIFTASKSDPIEQAVPYAWAKITVPGTYARNIYITTYKSSIYPIYDIKYIPPYGDTIAGIHYQGFDSNLTIFDENFNTIITGSSDLINLLPTVDYRERITTQTLSPGQTYWLRFYAASSFQGYYQRIYSYNGSTINNNQYFYNTNDVEEYRKYLVLDLEFGDVVKHAQAAALITSPTKLAHARAHAWITSLYKTALVLSQITIPIKLAQAQVSITVPIKVAQAMAFIDRMERHAQADVWIDKSKGLAQTQAQILVLDNNQSALAGVLIAEVDPISGATRLFKYSQALAHIKVYDYGVCGQANAWIGLVGYGQLFYDSFSRTTTAPPFNVGTADTGQAWIWNDWDTSYSESTSPTYVNGSELVLPGYRKYDSMHVLNVVNGNNNAEFYFDFYLPASGDNDWSYRFYNSSGWRVDVQGNSDTDVYFGLQNYGTYIATSSRSAWYRVKALITPNDTDKISAKLWKIGDAEPGGWQFTKDVVYSFSYITGLLLDIYYSPNTEYARFDNIKLDTVTLLKYNQSFALSTASILAISHRPAQAQVILNQSMYVGNAASWIEQTYNKFAQAQVWIRKLIGIGQAQAKIPFSIDSYSQMVRDDGATHLYGVRATPTVSNKLQDEINITDGLVSGTLPTSTPSPVLPEKLGALQGTSSTYILWNTANSNPISEFNQNNWTLEGWIKAPSTSPVRVGAMGVAGTGVYNNYFSVYFGTNSISSTGTNIYVVSADALSQTYYNTGVTYVANAWYYIIITFSNKEFKVYINGQLTNTITRSGWETASITSMYLGRIYTSSVVSNTTGYVSGFDNIAIYPTTLSNDIIGEHYLTGLNLQTQTGQVTAEIDSPIKVQTGQAQVYIGTWRLTSQALASIKQTYPLYSSDYDETILADSPARFWPLDDSTTATARELVVSNTASLAGTGTEPTGEAVSGNPSADPGWQWYGTARYLSSTFYQPSTSAATVEAWFATTGTTGEIWQGRYGISGSSGKGITLSLGAFGYGTVAGKLNFFINSDSLWYGVTSNNYYNDGNLHHVVAVWEGGGALSNAQFKIYVDGQQVATTANSIVGSATAPLAGNTTGGGFLGRNYGAYTGFVSKVAFYTYALTASQVSNHYKIIIGPTFAQAQTYVGHFHSANARVHIAIRDISVHANAVFLIGTHRTGQAIAQVGYGIDGYRKTVLDDKPILYFPMDEPYYGGSVWYTASSYYNASYTPQLAADGGTSDGWASLGYSAGNTWWEVAWGEPQTIQTVKLINRPNYTMGSGRIIFSDGTTYSVSFPITSRQEITYNTPASNVTWMRIISDFGGNTNPGFTEVEAYNGDATNLVRFPVISDPTNLQPTQIRSIVGRRNATWSSGTGIIFREDSPTGTGTSIDFNNQDATVQPLKGPTIVETLQFPGVQVTAESHNRISSKFWLNAGDVVTLNITQALSSSQTYGLYKENDGNSSANIWNPPGYVYGAVGTWNFTATVEGIYHFYSWPYSATLTGAGTLTRPSYEVDSSLPLQPNDKITVEFWVKPDGSAGDPSMIIGFKHYYVGIWSTGRIGFGDGDSHYYYTTTGVLGTNNWYHVVATMINGAASTNNNKIYVNGVLQSLTASGTNATRWTGERFVIGGWVSNTSYRARYPIDELSIFNYELTAEQALAHYQARQNLPSAQAQARIIAFDVSRPANAQVQIGAFIPAQAMVQIKAIDWNEVGQAQALIHGRYGLTRMSWTTVGNTYDVGAIYKYDIEGIKGRPNYDGANRPTSWIQDDQWGMAWSARFMADETGTWSFQTRSDDGSDLWINTSRVVNNGFPGGHSTQTVSGTISLTSGTEYNLHARWAQGGGPWNIAIWYKRPSDTEWIYLTSNNPPWIAEYFYAGFAQAEAVVLGGYRVEQVAQAEARIIGISRNPGLVQAQIKATYSKTGLSQVQVGAFRPAQALATILTTYQKSALAAFLIGTQRVAQAGAKIKVYGVNKTANTQVYVSRTMNAVALSQATFKQTYPNLEVKPDYALASYGPTITDTNAFVLEGTLANLTDERFDTYWTTAFVPPEHPENDEEYTYVTVTFNANRIISNYVILPHKYNATITLQYKGIYWYSQWENLVENLYLPVNITTPLSWESAIAGNFAPVNAKEFRIKLVNGGDDNRLSLAALKIGGYVIHGPTFAQAAALFGNFQPGQVGYYISPAFDQPVFGQAKAQIQQTYSGSGQSVAWIIPPQSYANAAAQIVQTYTVYSQANVFTIPPTWVAQALATIFATMNRYAQALCIVKQEYLQLSSSQAFCVKPVWHAQSGAHVFKRLYLVASSLAKIGHMHSGLAAAIIIKGLHANAQAWIEATYQKNSNAAAQIIRLEGYGLSKVQIKQTYSKYGNAMALYKQHFRLALAQARIVQTYRKFGNTKVHIKTTYYQSSNTLASIVKEEMGSANVQVFITKLYRASGNSLTQIGNFKYAVANSRIIAFNVPRVANAKGYIVAKHDYVPPEPTSDMSTYLVLYENEKLPGYATQESLNSGLNIIGYSASYIDPRGSVKIVESLYETSKFSDYNGLENKTITIAMLVWEKTYADCKRRVQEAAAILRRTRGNYGKLYIQNTDKYYLVRPKRIRMEQEARASNRLVIYEIEFEARPWAISNETYSIITTSNGQINTEGRTLSDGGWTPTTVTVSGQDIQISGTSALGEITGEIGISGTVNNFVINSDTFMVTDSAVITPKDFMLYVSPGVTTFTVTGVSYCKIEWNNRWYL